MRLGLTILLTASALALATMIACAAAAAPLARGARAGHSCRGAHAGTPVGDGEYSHGVIEFVRGISCRHALRLVRPNYSRVLRLEGESGELTGTFRIRGFHCSWEASGPVDVKRCHAGGRRFRFL
jgi:hypothetical protein